MGFFRLTVNHSFGRQNLAKFHFKQSFTRFFFTAHNLLAPHPPPLHTITYHYHDVSGNDDDHCTDLLWFHRANLARTVWWWCQCRFESTLPRSLLDCRSPKPFSYLTPLVVVRQKQQQERQQHIVVVVFTIVIVNSSPSFGCHFPTSQLFGSRTYLARYD